MPHHRARHTPLGAGTSCVVSSSRARRSPRRPRGRTSPSRPFGSGCAAGGPPRRRTARRWPAWSSAPVARTARRPACRPRRSNASASCAAGPAGARGGSPTRSAGRIRPSIRSCGAAAARGPSPARGRRSSATSGRAPASCCTWTSSASGCFQTPGHAVTGDRTTRSRRIGFEYVHSIVDDCSRLAYSEIHDDEKAPTVTAFTRRALDWFLEHGIVCERLMTDNAFTYVHNRTLEGAAARPRDRPPAHPALHAAHQRQGRALPTDAAARVGLRHGIRLKRRPPRLAATLGAPLQRATHPQCAQQSPSHRPRSGGHRARQLGRVIARTLMLGAVAVGLWSASAAVSTARALKRTIGRIVFAAPCGSGVRLCPSPRRSRARLNLTRFFDERRNLVRVEA